MTSVVAWSVSEFASKAFVKSAMRNPCSPASVLSFFYGVDYFTKDDVAELESGRCLHRVTGLWYSGGPDYDALCAPFAPAVRKAGRRELTGREWEATVDGAVAQLVLCDQLSRNAFRGQREAFQYDDVAVHHANKLTSAVLVEEDSGASSRETATPMLVGTVYPPYIASVVTALMHSEEKEDHDDALRLIDHAKQATSETMQNFWKSQEHFELEHKSVIDRFGRYPHRNYLKGRANTAEEEAWLADDENLPGWAKSQLPLSQ